MNQTSGMTPSDSTNPWDRRSELSKPARGGEILAAILFFIASATLPFSLVNENVAIAAWGALIAVGYVFTRRTRGLTGAIIALSLAGAILPGVVLPLQIAYYPAIGAIVSAACVGGCAGAYHFTVYRRYWLLPLLSAVSAVAAYAVTGDWLLSLMALGLLPAAILLSVSTLRGEGCTTVICYGIGGLLISVVGLLAAWGLRTYCSLTADTLRGLLTSWKEGFVQAQIASRGELIAMIEERMTAADATAETVEALESLKTSFMEMMSDNAIRQSMDALFQILPAMLILCCSIPAFLIQRLLNAAYSTNGLSEVVTPESEFFTMSLPSAVLYAVSLFLSALAVDGMGFVSMVAENLCLILLPGMLLLGIRYFKQRFGGNRRPRRWITVTLAVILCCVMPSALYLGAFFGSYMRIMQAIQRAMKKKMDQNR